MSGSDILSSCVVEVYAPAGNACASAVVDLAAVDAQGLRNVPEVNLCAIAAQIYADAIVITPGHIAGYRLAGAIGCTS